MTNVANYVLGAVDASTAKVPIAEPSKQGVRDRAPVQLRDVLRVLDDDEDGGSAVLADFRRLDGLQHRWRRSDWTAMARALTYREDALELLTDCPRRRELRMRLRAVRRRLEDLEVRA